MWYKDEIAELQEIVRREVHREMAEIESKLCHDAGSYNYLLSRAGVTFFAHHPRPDCQIVHTIPHY